MRYGRKSNGAGTRLAAPAPFCERVDYSRQLAVRERTRANPITQHSEHSESNIPSIFASIILERPFPHSLQKRKLGAQPLTKQVWVA